MKDVKLKTKKGGGGQIKTNRKREGEGEGGKKEREVSYVKHWSFSWLCSVFGALKISLQNYNY